MDGIDVVFGLFTGLLAIVGTGAFVAMVKAIGEDHEWRWIYRTEAWLRRTAAIELLNERGEIVKLAVMRFRVSGAPYAVSDTRKIGLLDGGKTDGGDYLVRGWRPLSPKRDRQWPNP